jgi:uncharacterized membrane protein YcaP (DUF421 family)
MDPLRITIRCVVAYLFLLFLLRLAGKRTIQQGTTFDFVLALVLGDLVDNAIWAEVPMAKFVVASATIVVMKLAMTWFHATGRRADAWRVSRHGRAVFVW